MTQRSGETNSDSTAENSTDVSAIADDSDDHASTQNDEQPDPPPIPRAEGVQGLVRGGCCSSETLEALITTENPNGEVDAVICDPPYSSHTHEGRAAEMERADGCSPAGLAPSYACWGEEEIESFCETWCSDKRTFGWIVVLCDDWLIVPWREAFTRHGRYARFAAVPCVVPGMTVRLGGDGPSSWTVYAVMCRPEGMKTGTLPGAYTRPRVERRDGKLAVIGAGGGTVAEYDPEDEADAIAHRARLCGSDDSARESGRGKPIWLMEALVRDYSPEGGLVCDPVAGFGTTLVAAAATGRRSIGCEIDEDVCAQARRRLGL